MNYSKASRLIAFAALLTGLSHVATAAEVLINDAKSQPESMTVAPDGSLIVGSAGSPFIYKVKKGATAAEKFYDASKEPEGTFFFGMLADGATKTLWACQLSPVAGSKPVQRHTSLLGLDLESGKQKMRWDLPGDNSTCNDFAIGPDKALYISDTANSKIYKLAAGASSAELFMDQRLLNGIDGITFLNGVLYVNNVFFNKLYRIPVDASGKPSAPVDIWMDQPILGPDGMRSANGKIFVAANGNGLIAALTVSGDKAHVEVLKDGLKTPTGVEPAGDMLWFTERGTGKVMSVPTPK